MAPAARHDSGVVLLNVLVVLALSAGLLVALLRLSDLAIARSRLFADASQALSIALAGEASAIAALRRDLVESPLSDHAGEVWAAVAQADVATGDGSFALQIEDAQARLNLTGLTGVLALQRLQALGVLLDLRPEVARRLAARLAQPRPAANLAALAREAGLAEAETAALTPYLVVLPDAAAVNLNTCPDALFPVLFGSTTIAATLLDRRARQGFLTEDDLSAANAIVPPGAGFVSRYFVVTITVRVGDATQRMTSLLGRGYAPGGVASVGTLWRGPLTAPALR